MAACSRCSSHGLQLLHRLHCAPARNNSYKEQDGETNLKCVSSPEAVRVALHRWRAVLQSSKGKERQGK